MTITVECPHCGDHTPIPETMNRYEWKSDHYSQATKDWHCWNCGEKITVKVSRHIFAAEVMRYVEDD